MITKQLIVGSMSVCCYLVGCEKTKKAAVIDPGGNEERILAAAAEAGLEITAIINTHGHPDHVCGNAVIKEKTGAPIIMHQDDVDFFAKDEVRQYFSMLGLPESPPPDRPVRDNDTIEIGGLALKVLFTPGHTPGGMCLYGHGSVFTGDTLFVGGVGRTDFPGGDTATLVRSIRERLLTLPPDTIVWPGHGYGGDSSTIGIEAKTNPFVNGEI